MPKQCALIGDAGLRESVRHGIEQAQIYGIDAERDVCLYVGLMFALGTQFDRDPQLPWAAEVLSDQAIPRARLRVQELHARGSRYLDITAGEKGDADILTPLGLPDEDGKPGSATQWV